MANCLHVLQWQRQSREGQKTILIILVQPQFDNLLPFNSQSDYEINIKCDKGTMYNWKLIPMHTYKYMI